MASQLFQYWTYKGKPFSLVSTSQDWQETAMNQRQPMTLSAAQPLSVAPSTARIVAAAFVGTALEWYDFFLFGTTAAIVFAPLFFPNQDSTLSVIGAFLGFGVGFVARPVGAVVFGHIGDRYGRRGALVATISLMGSATALIGLLPPYASAGIVAPILLTLLRAAQGVAAGGEWGGATLLAIEHAPRRRRNLYASIVQLGSPVGTLLSSGAVAIAASVPRAEFLAWTWRVPFIASILLVAVALWLRWNVEETPRFRELAERGTIRSMPVLELVRTVPGRVAIGVAAYLLNNAGFFILSTFMIDYTTRTLGLPSGVILQALTVAALVQMFVLLLAGRLADLVGAPAMVIGGYVVGLFAVFPVFMLVDTKSPLLIALAMSLGIGVASISYAVIGSLLSKLFPEQLRYSGLGLSANLSGLIAGFMPALATACQMLSRGSSWGPAMLLLMIAATSLVGAIFANKVIRHDAGKGNE
jgi:MFS family permease